MRRIFIYVVCAVLVVAIGSAAVFVHFNGQPDTNEIQVDQFCVEDYQWELKNWAYEANVGPIEDAYTAIGKAKELWMEVPPCNQYYDPANEIIVSYDPKNMCWKIRSILPSPREGVAPCAIIQKDGRVLAVYMG